MQQKSLMVEKSAESVKTCKKNVPLGTKKCQKVTSSCKNGQKVPKCKKNILKRPKNVKNVSKRAKTCKLKSAKRC